MRFLVVAILVSSCVTEAQPPALMSSAGTEILRFDEALNVDARLGRPPTQLDTALPLGRYAVQGGNATSPVFVLFPERVKGTLPIPFAASGQSGGKQLRQGDRAYLDQLLAVHRRILTGDIVPARRMHDQMVERYPVTYGIAVLGGTLAVLQGQSDVARYWYQRALSLNSRAKEQLQPVVDALVRKLGGDAK